MAREREVEIETLRDPRLYTHDQIMLAVSIAAALGRGTLVLTVQPDGGD